MSGQLIALDDDAAGAEISADGKHRYLLWRRWNLQPTAPGSMPSTMVPHVLWVLFNPSTATAVTDDPTIRKCIGFTKRWGYTAMYVVNLLAYRTAFWEELLPLSDQDAEGPDNISTICEILGDRKTQKIVVATGAMPAKIPLASKTLRWLVEVADGDVECLGVTRDGWPRHPARLGYDTPLQEWPGR